MDMTTDRRSMTPAEIIALARQAQEGNREASEALRVAVAEAQYPGQVKRLWTDIERECGCRTICFACEFGEGEHRYDSEDATLWPCIPRQSNDGSTYWIPAPDWPNDIGAAFELGEAAKKRDRGSRFSQALCHVLIDFGDAGMFSVAQAGPIERCAAFLIACGEGGGDEGR